MPLELGQWHGRPTEMDPKIALATEAAPGTIVNRVYQDESGHSISMHTAMFADPRGGVFHTPIKLLSRERMARCQRGPRGPGGFGRADDPGQCFDLGPEGRTAHCRLLVSTWRTRAVRQVGLGNEGPLVVAGTAEMAGANQGDAADCGPRPRPGRGETRDHGFRQAGGRLGEPTETSTSVAGGGRQFRSPTVRRQEVAFAQLCFATRPHSL